MVTPNSTAPVKDRRRFGALALIVVATASLVAIAAWISSAAIEKNQRAWLIKRVDALVPSRLRDNDLFEDRIMVRAPDILATSAAITIFRARLKGQPTAAVLTAVAPDGYGGAIDLLIGVDFDGALLGVDVLRHNETQGIGDGFAPHRSNWLRSLIGHSLDVPSAERWTIKKDGGDFDQFTGASITPRAILKAIRRTLEYYSSHRERIFAARAEQTSNAGE